MDAKSRAQPMDSEEALLAAQESFNRSTEAPSAQVKVKRPTTQTEPISGAKKDPSNAPRPRVSWSPDVTDSKEAADERNRGGGSLGTTDTDLAIGGSASAPKPIRSLTSCPTGSLGQSASGASGSQLRPRVGAGADLAADDEPLDDDDEIDAEINGGGSAAEDRPPYEPLPTVGAIKEKGYEGGGVQEATIVAPVPAPRATPFPEARHRSEGPQGSGAPHAVVERLPESDDAPPFDPATVIPLSNVGPTKKKAALSKFRQAMLDTRTMGGSPKDLLTAKRRTKAGPTEEGVQLSIEEIPSEGAEMGPGSGREEGRLGPSYGEQAALRSGTLGEGAKAQPSRAPQVKSLDQAAIDRENRARLAGMSAAEVAEEQAELQQMLPPGVLEALRKRGATKLGGQGARAGKNVLGGGISRDGLGAGQVGGEESVGRSEGDGDSGRPLRRQPTPLPGAIPAVRKGQLDSLEEIPEDEGVETGAEDMAPVMLRGDRHAEPQLEGVAGGGSLRRQPTPLPGAIPKAVKSGRGTMEPLTEEEESEDSGAVLGVHRTRLARQPTPMPSAILGDKHKQGMELSAVMEEESEDELGTAHAESSVKNQSGATEQGFAAAESASERPGPLARQPTPLPGSIPAVKSSRPLALGSLCEGVEEEDGETEAGPSSAGAVGVTERLARQPTPLPGVIPTPRTRATDPMLTVMEEEEEEGTGEETQAESAGRQSYAGPSRVPSASKDPESEPGTVEEQVSSGVHHNPVSNMPQQPSAGLFNPVNASDMRFDLDGSLLAPEPGGGADVSTASEKRVAERDILRSEGDPSGAGYTLKEAAALARSTVPGQRAVALRLIAAVLRRAVHGMHGGGWADRDKGEDVGLWWGVWARVWAYALGQDLQLAVVLRSALDDSHASVLSAATQALGALLTCDANEPIFEDTEALWTGPKQPVTLFTGPCDRSWGVLTAGVSSWGRWTARADADTALETGGALGEGDVREETVGDDARLAASDVAVGLLRMGILPRIRYILEVVSLPTLDEPLLALLIALARHSSAAARAVRDCPRLLPALRSIFVGLPAPGVRSSLPSQAAQAKAVKLLTVLSSAERASAGMVVTTGLLQLATRHLFSPTPSSARYPPAFSEVLRLWRTCALYGQGGPSFSDYYAPLSFVLEPPAGAKGAAGSAPWRESAEAYLLLEALARTLPSSYENETGTGDEEEAPVLLDWPTVGPLVETACQWLSPTVLTGLSERAADGRAAPLLATAAVLHFLATVSERNAGQLGRLERTLVDAVLAPGGVLQEPGVPASPTTSFVESLGDVLLLEGHAKEATLAAASCLQGLLRLTSALTVRERLGAREQPAPSMAESPAVRQISHSDPASLSDRHQKNEGSVEAATAAAFGGLAERLTDCLEHAGAESGWEEERRSAAAGLGLGWGLTGREVWGEWRAMQRVRANLLATLYERFSGVERKNGQVPVQPLGPVARTENDSAASEELEVGAKTQAICRLRAALVAIRMAGPGDFKPVLGLLSSAILSTDVLGVLLSKGAALMDSLGHGGERLPGAREVRQVLLPHFASQWLIQTSEEDDEEDDWDPEAEVGRILDADARGKAPGDTLHVEATEANKRGTPAALVAPITGQKLPLPLDWILSPTAVAAQLSSSTIPDTYRAEIEHGVKRLVRAGLALLLGLEACESLEVPERQTEDGAHRRKLLSFLLPRKLHALSEVFLAGGELFLDSDVAPLLRALQKLYGRQIPPVLSPDVHTIDAEAAPKLPSSTVPQNPPGLDFAAAAGASYEGFAEALAEQFAATSFGDPAFGRQVALVLRRDVTPGILRVVVWKALADARALHLLPPAMDCLGDPRAFLEPPEVSRDVVELYAAALRSGALDGSIALGPGSMAVTALVALHHLAAALDHTIEGQGAGSSMHARAEGALPMGDNGEGRQDGGAEGGREADMKRWVQGLLRSWLASVAQGRSQAKTLAAFVARGWDMAGGNWPANPKERRIGALIEAAGGDSGLLNVVQALEEQEPCPAGVRMSDAATTSVKESSGRVP